jgi:hypothetical protein
LSSPLHFSGTSAADAEGIGLSSFRIIIHYPPS